MSTSGGDDGPMTNGFHTSRESSMESAAVQEPAAQTQEHRDSRESSRLTGVVKWFNAKAGYGFITRSDTGEDVFVHFTGISRKNPRHMMKSLGDGEIVEFNILATNVSGVGGRPVRGNPYVSHIPIRRNDSFASGDPVMMPHTPIRRYLENSRIPRWMNWR